MNGRVATARVGRNRRAGLLLVAAMALGGCVAAGGATLRQGSVCDGPGQGKCLFDKAPLQLMPEQIRFPDRPFTFRRIAATMNFVDARGSRWPAPVGTITDGASIPAVFLPVLGNPTRPEFAAAAAIHDAICGYGNQSLPSFHARPWREAHRAFYEALIVGGTRPQLAMAMYAAVMMGGPRWEMILPENGPDGSVLEPDLGHARPALAGVEAVDLQGWMRDTVAYIDSENPSLNQIARRVDATIFLRDPRKKKRLGRGYVIDERIAAGLPPPGETGDTVIRKGGGLDPTQPPVGGPVGPSKPGLGTGQAPSARPPAGQ